MILLTAKITLITFNGGDLKVTERTYNVALVGATGAVGQNIRQLLEKRNFPINDLRLLSSKRSAGTKITFKDKELIVQEATPEQFENIDIAFFSAGGAVTKQLAEAAIDRGAIVIDNTSAFRMDETVPLVVPEVNPHALDNHQGLIANPNCSTIQMVVALKPIFETYGLTNVIVSTYQAVSGAGLSAIEELKTQINAHLNGEEMEANILPAGADKKHYPIAFNALPQIDLFEENGYTAEEMKMINETKKIMELPNLSVAATCVRLPVVTSHSESVFIEIEKDGVSVDELKEVLREAPSVILQDDPATQTYPTPLAATNKDEVFVGRIRKDLHKDRAFHLWIVSDNLMKGAALNTVQIAETLIAREII